MHAVTHTLTHTFTVVPTHLHSHTYTLSLSLSHTHWHTHTLSLSPIKQTQFEDFFIPNRLLSRDNPFPFNTKEQEQPIILIEWIFVNIKLISKFLILPSTTTILYKRCCCCSGGSQQEKKMSNCISLSNSKNT